MMTVDLSSTALMHDLVADLTAARCLVRPVDETRCRVAPLDEQDSEEALVELRFYVAVWAAAHPGVVATVSS